jgi:PAS domain S-box-containing protein
MKAPLPADEAARLASLRATRILDSDPEQEFDDLVRVAASVCGTPMATFTLIDADRQWFKAQVGMANREAPRDDSICARGIAGDGTMVIPDLSADERFADLAPVAGDPHMRFYAGAQLHDQDGHALGMLCVMDRRPRELDAFQLDVLESLGRQAERLLHLRRAVAELAEAQMAVTASEHRLQRVLDTAGEAYMTLDERGRIRAWNAKAEEVFGWTAAEVIGRDMIDTIVVPERREAHRLRLGAWHAGRLTERSAIPEMSLLRRDGSTFPAEGTVWVTSTPGHFELSLFIRDVAARKRSERLVLLLQEATVAANEASGVAGAFRRCLDAVCTHTGWPVAHAWLWDRETERLVPTGQWYAEHPGRVWPFQNATAELTFKPGEDLPGRAVSEGRPVWVTDVVADPNFCRALPAAEAWLATGMAFPVKVGDSVVGVLEFFTTDPDEPDPEVIDVMGQVGTQLGRAVERELAVRRERDLLEQQRMLLAATGDGIFALDTDGTCTFSNPAAARMLGREPADLVGESLHTLTHHSRPDGSPYPADECPILATLSDGIERTIDDEVLWRADGTALPAEYGVVPIKDHGRVRGVVVTFTDASKRRAVEQARSLAAEQLERANLELRELDRQRSDFVATVSHELRTPLTSIVGYAEMLADESLTGDQRHMVEVIGRNTRRLITLIEDLLTLSQIEAGSFVVEHRKVELGGLLEGTVQAIRPAAAARGIELVADVEDPGLVEADPDKLDRAVLNLLSNAVKFTPPGGRVTLSARRLDGHAQLTVSDTGVGIPLEEQPRLFSRFFRSSTATSNAIQGTGLGLVIVKTIVEQHGGEIRLISTPGQGTSVSIVLPLSGLREPSEAGTAPASRSG